MTDEGFDKIVAMIENLDGLVQWGLKYVQQDIECIVLWNDRPAHRIETLLDTLLGYIYMGRGDEEFKLLNEYYHILHDENAAEYDRIYEEITNDQD
ncbi:hypothetical protein KY362_02415 [Candidatus Woesearchaeota archaeon]|nr:hypothetical protein [Candidatus Woesearchaeota archaeon]